MQKTDYLGLALVEDSDSLKSAVEAMPNANMEALDGAAEAHALGLSEAAASLNALAELAGGEPAAVKFSCIGKKKPGNMPGNIGTDAGYRVGGALVVGDVPHFVFSGAPAEFSSFAGWKRADEDGPSVAPGGLLGIASASETLYAMWSRVFEFDPNGGSGAMAPRMLGAVPGCGFEREGFGFLGWNTSADASGTWYQPGERYLASSVGTSDAPGTLYAQWASGGGLARSGLTVGDLAGLEVRHA